MGNGSSQEAEKVGFRVLGVQPNSPAAKGGLVSFFDFIVAANGVSVKSMHNSFVDTIQAFEEKPLQLTVFNWKSHTLRDITLVPSRNWPGEGYLGVTIRFDTYHNAEEDLIHVLDVEDNSPADIAGLQPQTDFLLGTVEKAFKNPDVLFDELKNNINHPVEFYVYNSHTDEVRIAIIMPNNEWGGEGILGAGVAHGYLHVLPSSCCETIGKSHETVQKGVSSVFGLNEPFPNSNFLPHPPSVLSVDPALLSPITPPLIPNPPILSSSQKQASDIQPSSNFVVSTNPSLPPTSPSSPNSFLQVPYPTSPTSINLK